MTIASEISRLQNAKTNIKQAIIDKGVSVGSELMIDEYACCIRSIQQGVSIPLDNPIITGIAGNGKNLLYINDPSDDTYKGLDVTYWACSKVIRKQGSEPADENDGVLVTTINTRDQYESSPFEDTGLTNGEDYYYKVYSKASLGLGSESSIICLRPSVPVIDFLLVGGGGGGSGKVGSYGSPGGGGGQAKIMCCYELSVNSADVVIGSGGTGGSSGSSGSNGGNSSFLGFTVCGGGGGGAETSTRGGYSINMDTGCKNTGGYNSTYLGGGGAGTCGNGGNGAAGCACCPGKGGAGFDNNFSGSSKGYSGGGAGGSDYWGWNGIPGNGGGCSTNYNGCNAPGCGGGGGGAGQCGSQGGKGGGGVLIVRYPTSCCYNITGGCKYTCGNYTINCFTSNGTLTIN